MTLQHAVQRAAAALAFAALACAGSRADEAPPPPTLAGTSWRLVELRSSDDAIGVIAPDDPAKYELTFGADGRAALRLDCNRANGPYTEAARDARGGGLEFGALAMTRAMCPPESLEGRIARELPYVRSYLREGDRLILVLMADGGTQVWSRRAD